MTGPGIYFGPARRWPSETAWVILAIAIAIVLMATAWWFLAVVPSQPAAGYQPGSMTLGWRP